MKKENNSNIDCKIIQKHKIRYIILYKPPKILLLTKQIYLINILYMKKNTTYFVYIALDAGSFFIKLFYIWVEIFRYF